MNHITPALRAELKDLRARGEFVAHADLLIKTLGPIRSITRNESVLVGAAHEPGWVVELSAINEDGNTECLALLDSRGYPASYVGSLIEGNL
ncbi:hypothetical protein SEA_RASPUTIA_65 [Microbacterium phage Rasputia]|nr:hypothetical protein SEA_RASPUTIA_65 [Microbacterium phage Rasputia]